MAIKRLYVEKKKGFDIEAGALCRDLKENLGLGGLKSVRVINRYDIEGMTDAEIELTRDTVFAEPQVDSIAFENIENRGKVSCQWNTFPAESESRQCGSMCSIMMGREKPTVRTAKVPRSAR